MRRLGALLAVFVMPVLMLLLLTYFKSLAFQSVRDRPFPDAFELSAADESGKPVLPPCIIFDSFGKASRAECIPLAYSWSDRTGARELAQAIGSGVACPGGDGADGCAVAFESPQALANAVFDHPGLYDAMVIVEQGGAAGLQYTLWKNSSAEHFYAHEVGDRFHFVEVQKAVEEAALRAGLGGAPAAAGVRATVRKLPAIGLSEGSDAVASSLPDVVDTSAGTLMLLGLTISSVLTMQLIVQEKREGLLGLLRMQGLRESTYWLSWFIILSVAYLLSGLLVALVGLGIDVDLFKECDVGVHWMAAFLYLFASCAFILMCAACVKAPWATQIIQFVVIVFNVMFQSFVSTGWFRGSEAPTDFWTPLSLGNPDFSVAGKIALFLFPAFQYGKILHNVYSVTGVEGGRSQQEAADPRLSGTPVRHYNWSNVHQAVGWNFGDDHQKESVGFPSCFEGTPSFSVGCRQMVMACSNDTFTLPACPHAFCNEDATCDWVDAAGIRVGSWYGDSTGTCFACLFVSALVYLLLAWYLAQIFSAGTGSSKPFYFPLLRSYWTGVAPSKGELAGAVVREQELSAEESSARLWKLSKSYASTTALRELSLVMRHGEIFCLLGQNGAGKTTTISVLTGLHPPTHGEAFVNGLSVKTAMPMIQAVMGVCPQDNVLFEGISGRSHLCFWGRYKGMQRALVREEADRLLASVGLTNKASVAANTYSGGMKRRLSVAIASIAAPSIVFLDEPTTGLDPLARMQTWESIAKLKESRIVCLTTHSMEEADSLGDNIGILAAGRLRALGTPLFLKDRFGTGYHITLLCDEERSEDVLEMLRRSLPTADIISNTAGHITVGVPQRVFHLVPNFFAMLEESKARGEKVVNEWSISASTLEEVFLKVAVQDKALNADIEDPGAEQAVAAPDRLVEGLTLHALEGRPVHMTLVDTMGKQLELDFIRSMMCTAQVGEEAPPVGEEAPPVGEEAPPAPDSTLPGQVNTQEKVASGAPAVASDAPAASASEAPAVASATASAAASATASKATPGSDGQPAAPAAAAPADQSVAVGVALDGEAAAKHAAAAQIRGLMIKSFALQRKHRWANFCRLVCTVTLVAVSVLFNTWMVMMIQESGPGAGHTCAGGFVIDNERFTMFARSEQGLPARQEHEEHEEHVAGGYRCEKSVWTDFLANGEECRDSPLGADLAGYHLARDPEDDDHDGWEACLRTFIQRVPWQRPDAEATGPSQNAGCRAESGNGTQAAGRDLACSALGQRLPDFCAWRAQELRHEDVEAVFNGQQDIIGEALATLNIWHEGPLDMELLASFPEHWVRANSTSWHCGARRVRLHVVESMEEAFKESQRLQRATAMALGDIGCVSTKDEATLWSLGIGPQNRAAAIPLREGDLAQGIDEFKARRFPDVGLAIRSLDESQGSLDYEIWVYGHTIRSMEAEWRVNQVLQDYPLARTMFSEACAVMEAQLTSVEMMHSLVSSISDGLLQKLHEAHGGGGSEAPRISSLIYRLPELEFTSHAREWSAFVVLLFLPIVSMMNFPLITHNVQVECVEKNVLSMQVQSLKLVNYWVSTYLWSFLLYSSNVILFYLCNLMANVEVFKVANHGLFVVVLALWGHSQICLGCLMATSLGRSKLTTVLCYTIIILTMVIGPILAYETVNSKRWATVLFIIPPLNFIRGTMLVLLRGAGEMSSGEKAEFAELCVLQLVIGTALFVVGLVLHSLRQGTLTMHDITTGCRGLAAKRSAPTEEPRGGLAAVVDKDVEEEVERVRGLTAFKGEAVVVRDLEKEYSTGYRAVRGVSFSIKEKECFGLLGPNGAGKTTVMNMLSGSQGVTAGEAWVGGFDVRKSMRQIRQVIGICPQFDIVWTEMTVLEHLLLYARIKNIPRHAEKRAAFQVAEAVQLDGDPLRMEAGKLSGGQRRRLSLGVALVANPRVIFLDEPSTGLDPETRQGLWRIISSLKQDHSIVLTTHSMEEADVLCGRIGIMALGRLRCLGTPVHLKNKFGQGYQLAISLRHDTMGVETFAKLDDFIKQKICPNASLLPSWKGALLRTYSLPQEAVKVSKIFECITEDVKRDIGIQEWSLNQTSLNEVFLTIARESETW